MDDAYQGMENSFEPVLRMFEERMQNI